MDLHAIQSQLMLNSMMITELEPYVKTCKNVMNEYVDNEQYKEARLVQKEYQHYRNKLRSLVALQKALKKDKREKVGMWRFQRDVERVKEQLLNNIG